MAVETARMEIEDALNPNRTVDVKRVIAELETLPFEGRSFTTVAGAQDRINELGALFSKSNIDSGERKAAEDAMRILMRQLEEDRDEGTLDDDKPKARSNAAIADGEKGTSIAATKSEITRPQTKLTPDSRVDLLLSIAEHSPIPYSRLEAIDAVDRLTAKRGATEDQRAVLHRIQDQGPGNVKEPAGDILSKLTLKFHHPEMPAPKPTGRKLTEGDGT